MKNSKSFLGAENTKRTKTTTREAKQLDVFDLLTFLSGRGFTSLPLINARLVTRILDRLIQQNSVIRKI